MSGIDAAAPAAISIVGVLVGAALSAYFVFFNAEVQKRRRRSDLYQLLRAEIMNLKRHCSVVEREIGTYRIDQVAHLKTTKYRDGAMLFFDIKESPLLNLNLCQDLMQLSLLSRNNDIHIQDLLDRIEKTDAKVLTEDEFSRRISYIKRRMEMTHSLSDEVLLRLDKFARNPKAYREPVINW
jgi:hypothetical protein